MSGARTLQQTEEAMSGKLADLDLDVGAMTAISNLYRVASAVRNHFEQSVLKNADLTWTAFVVLWVVWIWESMETRHVAAEAGITKGTLTGVVQTLEARGLVVRTISETDRRRTFLSLTDKGERVMAELYPAFNREEQFVVGTLSERRVKELGSTLRRILTHLESAGPQRQTEVLAADAEEEKRRVTPRPQDGRRVTQRARRGSEPRRRAPRTGSAERDR